MKKWHTELLTQILSVLKSSEETMLVKVKAAIPLIQLCINVSIDQLTKEAVEDDKSLVNILLSLIPSILENKEEITKEESELVESLGIAIRSIVSSQPKAYLPFAEKTFKTLFTLAKRGKSEEDYAIRASAIFCIGELITATGKSGLPPNLMNDFSEILFESLEIEDHALRAAALATWSQVAPVLGSDSLQYLEKLVPFICRALAADYGQDEEEEPEEEEEDEEVKEEDENVQEERKFALECYRSFVEATGPAFLRYQDRCFEVVFDNAREYSDEIKVSVATLLGSFTHLYPLPANTKWTPGANLEFTPAQKKLFSSITQILFFFIHYSQDQYVVAESLNTFTEILKIYGQGVFEEDEQTSKTIMSLLTKLLNGKAACQTEGEDFGDEEEEAGAEEEEEEEEEEEDGEDEENEDGKKKKKGGEKDGEHVHGEGCAHDEEEEEEEDDEGIDQISMATLDLLTQYARVRGAAFTPQLTTLFPTLLKSFKDEELGGYSFGCFADIVSTVGPTSYTLLPKVFPLLIKTANKYIDNLSMFRNSAYAMGLLAQSVGAATEESKQFMLQARESLLKAVEKLKVKKEEQEKKKAESEEKKEEKLEEKTSDEEKSPQSELQGCIDNVISAIGKIIVAGESTAEVKVEELVPIFVNGLPLTDDLEEGSLSYSNLFVMLQSFPTSHPNVIEPQFVKLINVLAEVLSQQGEEIPDDMKPIAATCVEHLKKQETVQKEIASWSEEKRSKFEADLKAATEKPAAAATTETGSSSSTSSS